MKRLSFALAIALAMLACAIQLPNQLPTRELPTEPPALAIEPKPEPKLPTRETGALAIVTAIQSLNVRERAGEYERVIGALYHGDTVTLTGKCSEDPTGWAEIVWTNGAAWVNADFLSKNKCSEE